jgi:hypothetical protein
MRLNFMRAALSLDLNNSTLAHDAVGPSTPTNSARVGNPFTIQKDQKML